MTITVECPSCASTFPVDSNKIPEGGVRARCSTCSTIFRIEKPEPASTSATPTPTETGVPGGGPPEAPDEEEARPPEGTGGDASGAGPAQPPADTGRGGPALPSEASPASPASAEIESEAPVQEEARGAAEVATPETEAPSDRKLGWGASPASPPESETPTREEPGSGEASPGAEVPPPAEEEDEEDDFDPWGEPPGATPDTGIPARAPSREATGEEPAEGAGTEPSAETEMAEAPEEEPDRHSVTVSQPPSSAPPGFGAEELPGDAEVVEPEPPDEAETEPDAGTVPDAVPSPSSPPSGFRFGKRDPDEKARRLARVLVSDMIMYNPERHARALENDTLKEDFEEEIGKSWTEYVEQVGEEMARENPYFAQALNEILAKGRDVFQGSPPY